MKVVNASYQVLYPDLDDPGTAKDIYRRIETAGRTCYKSEDKITDESAEKFVRGLIRSGHEAMIEHASMTVKFIVDRGVSHEIVRHRLASFAQESTRYCNYSKDKFGNEITVVEPCFFREIPNEQKMDIIGRLESGMITFDMLQELPRELKAYYWWAAGCFDTEADYFNMIRDGYSPQEARCVLPNSLKTEVVMTANMREWRHFLKLRAAGYTGKPHPQMLEVAVPLLNECELKLPALFEDIKKNGYDYSGV